MMNSIKKISFALTAFVSLSTHAAIIQHTNVQSFYDTVGSGVIEQNFESYASGSLLPNGAAIGDYELHHSMTSFELVVENVWDTSSGGNYLGTTDGGVFQDLFGVLEFSFFEPIDAFSIFLSMSDYPWPGEWFLSVNGISYGLDPASVIQQYSDGGYGVHLSITASAGDSFKQVSLRTVNDGQNNGNAVVEKTKHRIAVNISEPGNVFVIGIGLILLMTRYRSLFER
ncbi:hypothetical protein [Bowmanella denitrificans]|uniref:hypothetical protein n=1 Tax=Bowmanella denitrificans TaxID=366582 RepID=UPI0011AF94B4|nr:hypothetical protein [Bowmanella denitrificans]